MHLWNRFLKESKLSILLVFSCLFVAQAQNNRKTAIASCEKKITEGVRGLVFNVNGNQMPAPGKGVQIKKGVQRQFGIFQATRLDLAKKGSQDCFFQSTGTKLLKKAKTDKNGCFALELKPGKYSLLIREKGEWYANSFGPEGEIFQFEVFADSVTTLDFRINHGAWY